MTVAAFLPYYAGTPTNPRFVYDYFFTDPAHTFTRGSAPRVEHRTTNVLDYVLGVFYENQTRTGAWTIAVPGSPERGARARVTTTLPCFRLPAATARRCHVPADRHAEFHRQVGVRRTDLAFHDARPDHPRRPAFRAGLHRRASPMYDYTFPTHLPATPHDSPASKTVGKVDPSYEYATISSCMPCGRRASAAAAQTPCR